MDKDDYYRIGTRVVYNGDTYMVTDHTIKSPRFTAILHYLEEPVTKTGQSFLVAGRDLSPLYTRYTPQPLSASKHTDTCFAQLEQGIASVFSWKKRWPNYCPACDGYGEFHTPATMEEPEDVYTCHLCTDNSICPRCGEDFIPEIQPRCPHCEFMFASHDQTIPADNFMPPFPECNCWLEEGELLGQENNQ
jgi:hypothetical protein